MRIFLLLSLLLILISCSGNLRIEPLIGEDQVVHKLIRSKYKKRKNIRRLQIVVAAVYRALGKKDYSTVWRHLSSPTKRYLQQAAQKHKLDGVKLLTAGKLPSKGSADTLVEADLMNWLLLRDLTEISGHLSGVTESSKDKNVEIVYLIDKQSNYKRLRLFRESDGWKIHPEPRR